MRHGPAFLKCFAALLLLPLEAWGVFPSDSAQSSISTGLIQAFPTNQVEIRLKKLALEISYSPVHKQAHWVAYELGPEQLRNCVDRGRGFRPDPELAYEDSAQLSDYSSSGFDRGHLSPAADNKWSAQAMAESFYLSNISPQPPRFNQGIWARLENSVRAWAANFRGIEVITGPFLEAGLPQIGAGLSVPQYYFKALVTKSGGKSGQERRGIAFLLPTNAEKNFSQFAVPIDFVEEFTGFDFFPGMPGESGFEAEKDLGFWNPSLSYKPYPCAKSPHDFFAFPWQ